jgi:hypothetical protein
MSTAANYAAAFEVIYKQAGSNAGWRRDMNSLKQLLSYTKKLILSQTLIRLSRKKPMKRKVRSVDIFLENFYLASVK